MRTQVVLLLIGVLGNGAGEVPRIINTSTATVLRELGICAQWARPMSVPVVVKMRGFHLLRSDIIFNPMLQSSEGIKRVRTRGVPRYRILGRTMNGGNLFTGEFFSSR